MHPHYFELTVKPSALHELFIDFINSIFQEPIEEFEDAIILRSTDDDLEDIAWAIESFATELTKNSKQSFTVSCVIEKKENIDWIKSYQEGVRPVDVASFYVHPSWTEPKEGKINIVIDPALAFGSGHHPTTATCLAAIDDYITPKAEVLDVGCGSGILAIACAKKGARVDACDTDTVSVENTLENAQKNSVAMNKIWTGSVGQADKEYDIIVANIVADVLGFIAKDIFKKLRPNGIAILSGILNKYETNVVSSYRRFKLIKRFPQDEWVTLIVQKDQ